MKAATKKAVEALKALPTIAQLAEILPPLIQEPFDPTKLTHYGAKVTRVSDGAVLFASRHNDIDGALTHVAFRPFGEKDAEPEIRPVATIDGADYVVVKSVNVRLTVAA